MDEVIFRSSQKIENLQLQLQFVAAKSKDLIQEYSQQSKSVILHAWNSAKVENVRNNVNELVAFLVSVAEHLKTRLIYLTDPRRIYINVINFLGRKYTKRDLCFALTGFVIGGLIGIAIGLSLRKPEKNVHYMQAVQVKHFLGIEAATVVEDVIAPVKCGDHDVLVTVKAASVHVIDAEICTGYGRNISRILRKLHKQKDLPVTLGRDCTGIVADLGRKVKRLEVGDEVWLTVPFWSQGTLCQTVLVSENRVGRKPKTIGFEGACSLPYAGSIAFSALEQAGLNMENAKEKKILIQGACTPVGCILIQLLKNWNASVSTTCQKRAVPVAKALGAKDIIVLSDNNSVGDVGDISQVLDEALLKELENYSQSFDVVINTRHNRVFEEEFPKLLQPNGVVISTLPKKLLSDNCGIIATLFIELYVKFKYFLQNALGLPLNDFDETHLCHVSLDKLMELVEEGCLQTVVEKVLQPHDIELALNHVQSPQSIGSSIVTFKYKF